MTRYRSEEGVALITALLAVIIIGGLAVVFVARATTETRASGFSRDFETAIHTAESAADVRLAALNKDGDHVTLMQPAGDPAINGWQNAIDGTFLSDGEERAWVLEQRALVPAEAFVEDGSGEAFAFRPGYLDGTETSAMDVVYSAGAIPGFDDPDALIRVVKLQVGQDFYNPQVALLTGGDLKFGGSASVVVPGCNPDGSGCIADVHVNGDFTNPGGTSGSSSVIEGELRVAGGTCPLGVSATNGCVDAGTAVLPVPEFSARGLYLRSIDDTVVNPVSADWFDLCPDGTVREPTEIGPCLNGAAPVWPDDTGSSNFRGWSFQGPQNTWRGSAVQSGTFYVHYSDADLQGTAPGEQLASILVEQDPANVSGSGSLSLSGNPEVAAKLDDILFIADADIAMKGTGGGGDACAGDGAVYTGFIGAREQIDVGGNVRLAGAIIAADEAEEHPEVTRNTQGVSGNLCLEYDPDLALDFSGIWVIRYWSEL